MHIILAALGSIVTILVMLNKLAEAGIDLGGLNPFLWDRRRKWRKQYQGNPLYKIDSPLDATAILMVAIAKSDGDMTREDKNLILDLFENEFQLERKDAAGLMISSVHLLGNGSALENKVAKFLALSKQKFTTSQAESAVKLLQTVQQETGNRNSHALNILAQSKKTLLPSNSSQSEWH